jgi:hypothetical protein
MKSIARDDNTGVYVMFVSHGGNIAYTSPDGISFTAANVTGLNTSHFGDKDDLNLIFNNGRFVDLQIIFQAWNMRYCDNDGCDRRRVISSKTSKDGIHWTPEDLGMRTPDAQDPPELEFYRIRPFYVGNTNRLAAHTLQYATQPPQAIVGVYSARFWTAFCGYHWFARLLACQHECDQ